MNRLTAIGLASLAAYGLLIASKYLGMVSAAPDQRVAQVAMSPEPKPSDSGVEALRPEPNPSSLRALPPPLPREVPRLSAVAIEFRAARDLKAFADALAARAGSLTADERYHLAKALEECQFTTTINEDLAAYSAKQKRQFVTSLPAGDPLNTKRIAAYDAVDNTQRCLGFQNSTVSPREIDALYRAAAQQGDPRAQARLITAELEKNLNRKADPTQPSSPNEELNMLIGLLESRDPEALLYVGQYLARNDVRPNLRVGPNGEVPEPSAFLGGFSLVACDIGPECTSVHNRDLLSACAYGGYCNAQSFEELYQNFLASPWAYAQAMRYRTLIHTAIRDRNWTLIGITPKVAQRDRVPQ
jgi:hypothetical protein